jgi:regulator of sirC expression with transglutaminase-like and TPR domain
LTDHLDRFAELLSRDQFNLAEACLLIAADEYPRLDIAACVAQLDAMAATIRGRLARDAFPEQKIAALNHHLFRELEFRGNTEAYYDRRNSYLNEVLERRVGIPITLSIIYLEVGRRVGLRLQGISFPGHFLVRLPLANGQLVLDPFSRGKTRSEGDLRRLLSEVLPAEVASRVVPDQFLEPATSREIVARVLRNLKAIYLNDGMLEQALTVMQRMVLVLPESAEVLRDRGLVYARLGAVRAAHADLQNYLRRRPDAPDAAEMHAKLIELGKASARLH